jgi:Recombination directionality factor-like
MAARIAHPYMLERQQQGQEWLRLRFGYSTPRGNYKQPHRSTVRTTMRTDAGTTEQVEIPVVILTSPKRDIIFRAAELYGVMPGAIPGPNGDRPHQWIDAGRVQWRVAIAGVDKETGKPIDPADPAQLGLGVLPVLPKLNGLTTRLEMYEAQKPARRCSGGDGAVNLITGQPCQCPTDWFERKELAAKGKACKATAYVQFHIPNLLPGLSVATLVTHSDNAIGEFTDNYDRLAAIIAALGKKPEDVGVLSFLHAVMRGQGRDRYIVPVLDMPPAEELLQLEGRSLHAALGAVERVAITAGPASETPDGDDVVADAEPIDTPDEPPATDLADLEDATVEDPRPAPAAPPSGEPTTVAGFVAAALAATTFDELSPLAYKAQSRELLGEKLPAGLQLADGRDVPAGRAATLATLQDLLLARRAKLAPQADQQ